MDQTSFGFLGEFRLDSGRPSRYIRQARVYRGGYLEIQLSGGFAPDCKRGLIRGLKDARVAQLVEQRTENPRVGGSSPPPGTTFLKNSHVNHLNSSS